jgi:ribosomal protein L9
MWTHKKQSRAEVEKRRKLEKKNRRKKIKRKTIQIHEKVGKSGNSVFLMICGSGGRKIGSLKWRVRSQLAR